LMRSRTPRLSGPSDGLQATQSRALMFAGEAPAALEELVEQSKVHKDRVK
jgi:hypothetical protein